MGHLIALLALLACTSGMAQDAPPAARQPEPEAVPLKPDPARLKKPLPKRRSVQQRIETMPASPPIVTDGYRPTLHPQPPRAPLPSVQAATGMPPAPAQINSCDGGGCIDTSGARYNGGVGNTVLDSQGRNCTRTGVNVQCF
jgi:hypothetical protein